MKYEVAPTWKFVCMSVCVCAKNTNVGINCAFVKAHKGEKTVDETAETRATGASTLPNWPNATRESKTTTLSGFRAAEQQPATARNGHDEQENRQLGELSTLRFCSLPHVAREVDFIESRREGGFISCFPLGFCQAFIFLFTPAIALMRRVVDWPVAFSVALSTRQQSSWLFVRPIAVCIKVSVELYAKLHLEAASFLSSPLTFAAHTTRWPLTELRIRTGELWHESTYENKTTLQICHVNTSLLSYFSFAFKALSLIGNLFHFSYSILKLFANRIFLSLEECIYA